MEIINRKISELIPAEYNPRELTDKQHKDLVNSLTEFAMVEPIVINVHPERLNVIVGGHQRCKVWGELGFDTIPTVEVVLDLEKEMELNIRLNKNSGQFDKDLLLNNFDVMDLTDWGFDGNDFDINIDKFEEDEKTSSNGKECPHCGEPIN